MHIFTYLTIFTVFISAPLLVEATPTRLESLCEEVAFTLNESVTYGELTQEQADEVIDRCYESFS